MMTTSMYNHFKNNKCGILDPTNYKATSWYKQVVKDEVYGYAGATGECSIRVLYNLLNRWRVVSLKRYKLCSDT